VVKISDSTGPGGLPGLEETPEDRLLTAFMAVARWLKPRSADGRRIEPGAFYALHAVACHGPIRLSDLAGRLNLDASTVSRHVRNLEQAGYLDRTPDPADRRASQVFLSEAGRSVLCATVEVRRARVAAALAGWSEPDRHQLVTLLTQLAEDLSRTDSEAGMT